MLWQTQLFQLQRMKLYPFLILTFFTATIAAQESASVVLDKYFQTIGGQSRIERLQSIYSFADCTGPNGRYQTELFSAKGSKTIFRQIRENKQDYTGIVNGDVYWTKNPQATISNAKSAFVWRSHELQWMATHLTERFNEITFAGNETFAGKQAVKLSAFDELNKPASLYFDKNTNLLLGIIILNPFSETPETIQMEILDWKKSGKFLVPSKVSFTDKQGIFVLNFQIIKINQVDQSVFDVPEKIIAVKELMELHELQRKAHFNRDAKLLVSVMADHYTEISNGKINSPKKEDLIVRFQTYFDAVTFVEWDDIISPVIDVSEDATMAFMHVNKRVRLITKAQKEELTIFAWTSTFQKINGNWLMTSITSTVAR